MINSNKVLSIKRPFVCHIAMQMSRIQLREFERISRRMHKRRLAAVLYSTAHVVNYYRNATVSIPNIFSIVLRLQKSNKFLYVPKMPFTFNLLQT